MENMEEAVFEVCAMGDALKFQRLVQQDESVLTQTIGRARHTPLHLACKFKHNELASFILGLQPGLAKAKNATEETPLHEASRVGELDIVKELLDACPSVAYMLNKDRESALFVACSCGHSEVAWELCGRMDFLAWDEIGASCLQIAASKGNREIVRKILQENPSMAIRKDENGFSALHLASSKGHLGVINEFHGKDPNLSFLRDNYGRPPLHLAMIYNQVHVVKEFLLGKTRPASFNSLLVTDLINTADNNGDTVLHLAAKMNCLELERIMLRASLNLTEVNLYSSPHSVLGKFYPTSTQLDPSMQDFFKTAQPCGEHVDLMGMRFLAQIIELLLSGAGTKVNGVNNGGDAALDILQQIPAHGNEANVVIDKQIPARDNDEFVAVDVVNDSCRRMAIIQHLKARKRANPPSLTNMQMKLMMLAGLILTLTFQAVLSPPGGLWQGAGRGNHDINHKPGKAIQMETNPGLYKFFMAFNALGFSGSLALILIAMNLRIEKKLYVISVVVLAFISIYVAFILGLIMIS